MMFGLQGYLPSPWAVHHITSHNHPTRPSDQGHHTPRFAHLSARCDKVSRHPKKALTTVQTNHDALESRSSPPPRYPYFFSFSSPFPQEKPHAIGHHPASSPVGLLPLITNQPSQPSNLPLGIWLNRASRAASDQIRAAPHPATTPTNNT